MECRTRAAELMDAEQILLIHQQAVNERNAFVQEPEEFRATLEGKQKQIEKTLGANGSCLLVAEMGGQVVGWISLTGYELKKLNHVVMLGMAVHRDFRGCGVGTSLVKSAIAWARSKSHLRRIALAVFATNAAAVQVYKKSGFEIEGIERKEVQLFDGSFIDQIIMGLTW